MSYAESLLVLPQPNVETNFNGKVVSLKDTSQTEDYAMCSSNALTEQQSSGGTEPSQLTVSFPTPQIYLPETSYSSASALDPLSGVVVTSACSTAASVYTSVESTISYPPKVISESGQTQTSASPVQVRLGEQLQDTSNDSNHIILQQQTQQQQSRQQQQQQQQMSPFQQQQLQQLQLLLQSSFQQEQQRQPEQHQILKVQQEQPVEQAQQQERQQRVNKRQDGHASDQVYPQPVYQRQDGSALEQGNQPQGYQRQDGHASDQVYPQPVYQRQDGSALDQGSQRQGNQRQDGNVSAQVNHQHNIQVNETLLQQQLISSVLEAQAKKLDPNFKLPPNQMFLMLGEKMVIADKSLMYQLFGQSGQDPTLQTQGANQVSNQFQTSPAQGTTQAGVQFQARSSTSEPSGATSQLFGRSNDSQIQSRPQMTQPYYQNTGTRVASGAENQPQNLSNLPFQQYFDYSNQTPASAGFQPGYSGGQRNLLTQGPNQSRQSIFPRNNLPFSPANLDDDDLETDSSGLKRKNPVQMYGKTSNKANCSDESESSPGMNKQGVIDLTTANSSPNSVINVDDEDDDLEIDYVEDSSDECVTTNHNNIPFTVLSESERALQGVEGMKGKSSQRQVNKSKCLEDSGIYVDDSS